MSKEVFKSEKITINEQDLKIMIDLSREVHGNDNLAVTKGVLKQIEYAELVSTL